VYQASLEKAFVSVPVQIEAGRFYNRHERFSGYWDGVVVRYGPRGMGAGFASGFQPDRSNEGFMADLPKYAFFVDYNYRSNATAYSGNVSFNDIRGRNGYLRHSFVGWEQRFRYHDFRFANDVQVNRSAATNSWTITRLDFRTEIPVLPEVRLQADYQLRRPYSLWSFAGLTSYRRDRGDLGLLLDAGSGIIGFHVTGNRFESQPLYYTYSSFANFSKTRVAKIGFSSHASYWSRDDHWGLSVTGTLTRAFGRASFRTRYRFYQTDSVAGVITTHMVGGSIDIEVARRFNLTMQGQALLGELLTNYSMFTGIWIGF
jgi:hypothetical protein